MTAINFWQNKFTFSFWEHWKYPRFQGPQEINVGMRRRRACASWFGECHFPKEVTEVLNCLIKFMCLKTFLHLLFIYFSAYGYRGRCNVYSRQRGSTCRSWVFSSGHVGSRDKTQGVSHRGKYTYRWTHCTSPALYQFLKEVKLHQWCDGSC